ncbi:tetratricopeptide repeat protein [Roseinatronobacter alkalisoli]|uniref:Tetratricopeptide repeat protein n=1 Tax=Roseinatronobacter alkalisoli TaxID=3028235 RepID=A0ABT5TH60_9RHOB|nr:tetratricopeptide repeat protein [Roseinatronobacter sp. HJB301]MDD7973263.1 tetratricopeptide repeat protein [Roseinatronobacter sp. HJB301]
MIDPVFRTSLGTLALVLGMSISAAAQDQSERYEQLKADAARGDADAMYELGEMYYLGMQAQRGGPERDTERGVELFRPLAEAGHVRAQWRLGWAYEMGSGVERDAETAYRLYTEAAAQGFIHAKQTLGKLYIDGRGTESDYDRAYALLREAAEADVVRAMTDLARLYQDPARGPVHDPARAVHWFRMSAEQNQPTGVQGLSEAYLNGIGVERDPVAALRAYVEYEERTGREQTTALLRILSQLSDEERAMVEKVAEAENWLADD